MDLNNNKHIENENVAITTEYLYSERRSVQPLDGNECENEFEHIDTFEMQWRSCGVFIRLLRYLYQYKHASNSEKS